MEKRQKSVGKRASDVAKNGATWRRHSDGAVYSKQELLDVPSVSPTDFTNSKAAMKSKALNNNNIILRGVQFCSLNKNYY